MTLDCLLLFSWPLDGFLGKAGTRLYLLKGQLLVPAFLSTGGPLARIWAMWCLLPSPWGSVEAFGFEGVTRSSNILLCCLLFARVRRTEKRMHQLCLQTWAVVAFPEVFVIANLKYDCSARESQRLLHQHRTL